MEPNYPGNINTPTPYPQGPAPEQPKKRWPLSRKMTIIIGAVIALIAVLAIVLLSGKSSDKKTESGKKVDRSSLYTQRPGFENVGEGIGDAMALISKPSDKIVQYGGVNVVQACSILTIKDIRDANLKIVIDQLTGAVQRTFMDGEGPALLTKGSDRFLPFDEDSNHCRYDLADNGQIILNVYQPAYNNQKAIDRTLQGDYVQGADIEGFQRYTETRQNKSAPNTMSVFLRSADISAAISVDISDKATAEKLISLAAQRLRQGLVTPTPIEEFTYDSPIFTIKAVNGCALVNNAEFKAVLGVDSGPYVNEMMSSVVSIVENDKTKELYNYVPHHCKRRSPDGSTKDKTLTIRVDTYETAEGAKARTEYEKTRGTATKNVQNITPTIGDESYYADTATLDKAVVMRKGKVIVKVNYYVPRGDDDISAEERIRVLTPLVTSIANEKLKDY